MNIIWLLFSLKGRISRQPYWLFMLALLLITFVPAFTIFEAYSSEAEYYVNFVSFITLYPAIAVQVKRWHDIDKSGWWILINFIPFIGIIWAIIENGFYAGDEGENVYGKSPLKSVSGLSNGT